MDRYPQYNFRNHPYLQQQRPQPEKPRWRWSAIAVALFVVAGACLGAYFLFFRGGSNAPLAALINNEPAQPQKVRVEGRYLFNGTVVWARNMQEWSKNPDGSLNYAYPFSGLSTFDRTMYDAWTADLECPVLQEDIPLAQQTTETAFNCRPEFLPEAAKYFTFFNLANNHTHDFNGQAALDETRRQLEAAGIQYFGDFDPTNTDNICRVVALPVRVISTQEGQESTAPASLPVAFCAWHYFFRLPEPGELEVMKQYAAVMPVFAFVQQGVEYQPTADDYQRDVAHRIADLGPQFVVMNSAHWVQDGEVYNGVPILYSTGNFIFDQQYNNEVTRSASLDGSMSINYTPELDAWLALGESCKAQHNTCLEQIKSQGLQKPALNFTYNLVASDNSGKLTKRANAEIQAAVEQRVGWPAIQNALGQTQ